MDPEPITNRGPTSSFLLALDGFFVNTDADTGVTELGRFVGGGVETAMGCADRGDDDADDGPVVVVVSNKREVGCLGAGDDADAEAEAEAEAEGMDSSLGGVDIDDDDDDACSDWVMFDEVGVGLPPPRRARRLRRILFDRLAFVKV